MEDEPGFAELSDAQLDAIIRRHLPDVALESVERLPSTGVVNSIYALGSRYVLRVPRATEEALRDTHTEVVAAPVAREAGLRTPALIAFDESCALLDVPFTIFERVPGFSLAPATMDDPSNAPIWRDLGHELAILHMRVETCADPKGWLDQPGRDEVPAPFLDALSSTGYLSPDLRHWLGTLLDRLQPAVHQARTYRRSCTTTPRRRMSSQTKDGSAPSSTGATPDGEILRSSSAASRYASFPRCSPATAKSVPSTATTTPKRASCTITSSPRCSTRPEPQSPRYNTGDGRLWAGSSKSSRSRPTTVTIGHAGSRRSTWIN